MSEGLTKHIEIEKAFESFINSPSISPLGIDMQPYYWSHRARFKMMLDSMPRLLEPINVLDVGPTHFTMLLKDLFPHYEISTIDLSNNWKDHCEAVGIQFNTCNLDEGHIPFPDNYFHVVILTGVLEHIFAPPSDILNEFRRIIRPKGKLIIGVPNIARLNNRILFLFGITPLEHPNSQLRKGYHGHIHEYTMKELVSLLKKCNMTITKKKYVTSIPPSNPIRYPRLHSIMFRKRAIRLLSSVIFSVWRLIPSFGMSIMVECRKEVE
jgi:ubiquinone/menaquinone biosynthesis C-methylase UbiE